MFFLNAQNGVENRVPYTTPNKDVEVCDSLRGKRNILQTSLGKNVTLLATSPEQSN